MFFFHHSLAPYPQPCIFLEAQATAKPCTLQIVGLKERNKDLWIHGISGFSWCKSSGSLVLQIMKGNVRHVIVATMISTKCINLFGDSQWSALLIAHMASQQRQQTPLSVHCTPMSKRSLWKFRVVQLQRPRHENTQILRESMLHNLVCCHSLMLIQISPAIENTLCEI